MTKIPFMLDIWTQLLVLSNELTNTKLSYVVYNRRHNSEAQRKDVSKAELGFVDIGINFGYDLNFVL